MPGMSNGLKDLHVLMTADAVGGVWHYALDLASGLAAQRVRTTLVALGPRPSPERIAQAGALRDCQLIVTDWPLDWMAATAEEIRETGAALANLSRRLRPDLVHLNSPALAAQGDFAAPVVGMCHSCLATWWEASGDGPLPADFVWRRDLLEAGYRAADLLLAPTRAFALATQRVYRLGTAPWLVYNGRTAPPRLQTPQFNGGLFAFTAGRLWDSGKNLAVLDRAAARLDIPFLAAGPLTGPNGERVELPALQLLGELGEAELRERLAHRPIFASAARYEPFGLAVLEAAQAGCPLVLADVPTFRELWQGAAVFVAPDDDAGFAEEIRRLALNAAARARAGAAARRRARVYSVAAMSAGVLDIYRATLAGAGRLAREAAA